MGLSFITYRRTINSVLQWLGDKATCKLFKGAPQNEG